MKLIICIHKRNREIVNYIEDTQREENSSSFFNHLALLRFLAEAWRHLKLLQDRGVLKGRYFGLTAHYRLHDWLHMGT